MKKILVLLAVSGGLIFTSSSWAQNAAPAAAQAAVAEPMHKGMHQEHHPEIHMAMRKLHGAKENLEKAAHDYGGHRVKAIAAIDAAIAELKAALESDKK